MTSLSVQVTVRDPQEGTASGQVVPSPILSGASPQPLPAPAHLCLILLLVCGSLGTESPSFGPQEQGTGFIQKEQAENKPRDFPRSNHGVNSRMKVPGPAFLFTLNPPRCQGSKAPSLISPAPGLHLDLQVQAPQLTWSCLFIVCFRCVLPSSQKDAKEPL